MRTLSNSSPLLYTRRNVRHYTTGEREPGEAYLEYGENKPLCQEAEGQCYIPSEA